MSNETEIRKESNQADIEIIDSILNGNINDFSKIQKKYRRTVFAIIRRMVRTEEDVEDLVQETFIKAFNALSTYDRKFNFSSWLLKIASNGSIDFLRKRKMETISISQGGDTSEENDFYFEIPDDSLLPDAEIITKQQMEILNTSIGKLPVNYQKIIELRFIQELDYSEIASLLNIPLGTVKALLFRARKLLQLLIKQNIS